MKTLCSSMPHVRSERRCLQDLIESVVGTVTSEMGLARLVVKEVPFVSQGSGKQLIGIQSDFSNHTVLIRSQSLAGY